MRDSRLLRAARRMKRLKGLRRGTRCLLAAGILLVAAYAAEREPWSPLELRRLRGAALAGHGTSAPAVPHALSILTVGPMLDAKFRLPFAAAERWARECWLSTAEGPMRPEDVLSGSELYRFHSSLTGPGGRKVARGPGKALVAAFSELGLQKN